MALNLKLAWRLVERTPTFVPGLGIGILAVSVAAAIVVALPGGLVRPLATRTAVALALVAVLAGPLAYGASTMQTALSGGDPTPGPMAALGGFGAPGGPGSQTVTDSWGGPILARGSAQRPERQPMQCSDRRLAPAARGD